MRREITENSLPKAPLSHCHGPLHLSLLLKHVDHHPQVKMTLCLALGGTLQIPLAGQNLVGSSLKTQAALRRALPPLSVIRWNWLIPLQGCRANCQACPWGSHPNLTHPRAIQVVLFSLLASGQSRIDGCGGRRQHTPRLAFFREGDFICGRQTETCDFVLAFPPQKYTFLV